MTDAYRTEWTPAVPQGVSFGICSYWRPSRPCAWFAPGRTPRPPAYERLCTGCMMRRRIEAYPWVVARCVRAAA